MTTAPATYEIRVDGHLDDHWSARLGNLTPIRDDDGTTVLVGPIADQAQLHGVLIAVRDLGATLLSLNARGATPTNGVWTRAARPVVDHPLRTERLVLRPASADDAAATWSYRRLESVREWLPEAPTDLAAYRATFADPVRLASTVAVELDGSLIGDVVLRIEHRRAHAELGWVLDPTHTEAGYATETVRGLLSHSFTTLGLRRVVARCFLADDASWRLMEGVGMRREGHAVADLLHRSGHWLDTVSYAVLATEWTG